MIKVNQENYQQTKQFVINNLERSGFIYGNLDIEGAVNYIKLVDGQIVAMTNIINNRYCTYLFPVNCPKAVMEEVIKFMSSIPHSGGTVIGDYYQLFDEYYSLPANAINEVAVLKLKDNKYESQIADYLTIDDAQVYEQAVNTIEQFAARDLDSVVDMFSRSKVVGIKKAGQIVSSASLSSISDVNAVITGVFTITGHEGQGYAKDCVIKLLEDYASDRTITIFFSNPIAKQLYLSLGFAVNEQLIMYNNN